MSLIHVLMGEVMAEVGPIAKEGVNTEQHYVFRGIDQVVNAVGPVFRRHGVIPVPVLISADYAVIEVGRNKTIMRQATVMVRYEFTGPEGDHVDATVPGEAMDSGDKAVSKAMSVAYRIALLQLLCIPTGDPDPDSTSYSRGAGDEGQQDARRAESQESDPRQPLWDQLMRYAEAKTLAPRDVAFDFKEWSQGTPINDATLDQLRGYINHIHGKDNPPEDGGK